MNDTTQPGVSDDTNKGASDRDDMMSDIAKNAQKTRLMEEAGVDINNPMEVNLALKKMEEGLDPDPNAGKLDPEKKPDDDPETIEVKVNGIKKLVLKSEVDAEGGVANYQKARSADERMRQNAEERRRLDADQQALEKRELAIAQQEEALLSDTNNKPEPSTDASVISDEAIAIKDKMYSGDEVKTQEAVQDILDAANNTATPELNTQEIIDQTTAQVQWGMDLNQAKKDFEADYSDINSNQEYREYANNATKRIMAENPEWTPSQILVEAGEQSRLKFRDEIDLTQRENVAQAEEDERLKNKRATDNVRSNDATMQKAPEKKGLTPSEIVKSLQQGRSHAAL